MIAPEGWYVLTIILAGVAFVAGWMLGDKPRYRDRPSLDGDYCPTFWERFYYQQTIKRQDNDVAADSADLEKFINRWRKFHEF